MRDADSDQDIQSFDGDLPEGYIVVPDKNLYWPLLPVNGGPGKGSFGTAKIIHQDLKGNSRTYGKVELDITLAKFIGSSLVRGSVKIEEARGSDGCAPSQRVTVYLVEGVGSGEKVLQTWDTSWHLEFHCKAPYRPPSISIQTTRQNLARATHAKVRVAGGWWHLCDHSACK